MGRAPCCDKANVKRGPWSPEEDATLKTYLTKNGTGGNWISLPQRAGLKRCGKSCRLRWLNYLRPDIKHGAFSEEEDNVIISLYSKMGSRWSVIAANLPGRTDNDVKNHWNTKLKKRLFGGERLDRRLTNKFNPKIKNLTFTNDITNPLNYKPPTSSSTPTPSSSSPSPTYLDTNTHITPNYSNYSPNIDHNHHQFYVTIPSLSDLLAECTSNVPISTLPRISCYNSLYSSLDPPSGGFLHNPIIANSSSPYPFDQFLGSSPLVTDHRNASAGLYESNNVDGDPFLAELGFGSIQELMINSTSKYGDEEDIKPQGIGQGLTNY